MSSVSNLVRPVIFQSRLYLVWVESREAATTTSGSSTSQSTKYQLKYAHILHDGTWSSPVTITTGESILPLGDAGIDDSGMYCARDAELEKLYIFFYKKESSYSTLPDKMAGLSLSADGTAESISAASAAKTAGYIYLQLDTTTAVRLNTLYAGGSTRVSVSSATRSDYSWGYGSYTIMDNGSIKNLSATVSGDNVIVGFDGVARLVYNGCNGTRSRTQIDMIKIIGNMGDSFYLPVTVKTGPWAAPAKHTAQCVVNKTTKKVYFQPSQGYLENDKYIPYYAIADSNPTSSLKTTKNSAGLWEASDDRLAPLAKNIYVCRSNPFPSGGDYDFAFSDFDYIDTSLPAENVKLSASPSGESFMSNNCSKFTFAESLFDFSNKSVKFPLSAFSGNTVSISFEFSATAPSGDGRSLGDETFMVTLSRVDESSMPVISLNKTTDGAQYLQYRVYRVRVNTLFAKQLVARANAGLDTVLSMETQLLQEPKLGKGFYVDFVLPEYEKKSVHGSSRAFTLSIQHVVDDNFHIIYSGNLTDSPLNVKLFIPLDPAPLVNNSIARVFLETEKIKQFGGKGPDFIYKDTAKTIIGINDESDTSMFNGITVLTNATEPMDFSGANAIYFWEMFYYVPMMVFKRLLSESRFAEATQWIKYVWSPDGYLVNGQAATYTWNVRPLEEETTWHSDPLDSVDPDAVAQADPLLYKIATFISYIDLLIARGDAAYRQLERDTLNEAKMWYVQALDILGDEPYLLAQASGWSNPRLTNAASTTARVSTQQALLAVRRQVAFGELRTANSLTSLFLPQQNERLASYWQTLAQRLYNLRHNLSIDGSPLSLSVYATPADPSALLSAAVNASSGGGDLPDSRHAVVPLPGDSGERPGDGESADPVWQYPAWHQRTPGRRGAVRTAADSGQRAGSAEYCPAEQYHFRN
ncbi:hypothetical protein BPUN_2666 [Candidatus Paraburkholderia kirkii]|nr:hypothetical protein BPUN_2666 [Candidatus Paraburkholderia kirkii]